MTPRSRPFVSQRFGRGVAPGIGTRDAVKRLQSAYSPSQETTGEKREVQFAARLLHGGSSYMLSITDYTSRQVRT